MQNKFGVQCAADIMANIVGLIRGATHTPLAVLGLDLALAAVQSGGPAFLRHEGLMYFCQQQLMPAMVDVSYVYSLTFESFWSTATVNIVY